jgi:hypothetical protein
MAHRGRSPPVEGAHSSHSPFSSCAPRRRAPGASCRLAVTLAQGASKTCQGVKQGYFRGAPEMRRVSRGSAPPRAVTSRRHVPPASPPRPLRGPRRGEPLHSSVRGEKMCRSHSPVEAIVKTASNRWLLAFAIALFVAARGGNWLISRASIGATSPQLTLTWLQVAIGLGVCCWAWRRHRATTG